MLCPIAAGERTVGYIGAGIGGMDELSVSCVDSDMGNTGSGGTGEEYHITGLQGSLGYGSALIDLSGGSPGRGETDRDIFSIRIFGVFFLLSGIS